eukprot:CAMPEP_0196770190 /NCGR_PEP_ID=MMETSP1104-20130614/999_1 /TAXON_ID=33652 /ORGANISM="Cafeteria sp., Strain Caron Lab Isolate" /LENGTH=354 /DNA_ID=CAMNT_0042140299 /DNA_START=40 /DNA_END=1104 /DNA_ORIENTATION=+
MSSAGTQYAMAAVTPGDRLSMITFEPGELKEGEIRVEVDACGACHSDLHSITNEWKEKGESGKFPMVPGHEAIGRVVARGPGATKFELGTRVGIGPQRSSCGCCGYCSDHAEQLCDSMEGLYDNHYGGYATIIDVPESFAFAIPDALPTIAAAPLLCAGITTHAPLARYAKAGDRVGVIGIGGLGHVALQYASAMGCDTWAISRSISKREEALSFGAKHFLVSTDADQVKAAHRTFDVLLCCASGRFPLDDYLDMLKPRGTFVLLGLPSVDTPLTFRPFSMVMGEKKLVGSIIGGTADFEAMLQFSAEHNILPKVEVVPLDRAQEAIDKLIANTARYRMVLDMKAFREASAEGK